MKIAFLDEVMHEVVRVGRNIFANATYCSGIARRLQVVRDGFDSRLKPIIFDMSHWWLLTRRAQAHFAVSLNYC